jgi:hypothetical protein
MEKIKDDVKPAKDELTVDELKILYQALAHSTTKVLDAGQLLLLLQKLGRMVS